MAQLAGRTVPRRLLYVKPAPLLLQVRLYSTSQPRFPPARLTSGWFGLVRATSPRVVLSAPFVQRGVLLPNGVFLPVRLIVELGLRF